MCCASYDLLDAMYQHEDLLPPRSQTPVPDGVRTLRRTASYASVETIRPSNSGRIRRRIKEITEDAKHRPTRKCKDSAKKDVPKHDLTRGLAPESKESVTGRATTRGRRTTRPMRDSSHKSAGEEDKVLAAADGLYSGVRSEPDVPSSALSCVSDPFVGESLPKDDEEHQKDGLFSIEPSTHAVVSDKATTFQPRQLSAVDVKDVQFNIRLSDLEVTIWDGLLAGHHLFKCRLFLRCKVHPYDSVTLPHIPRFEMDCNTHPISGARYARSPVLQTTYKGATPGVLPNSDGLPSARPNARIHVDRFWKKILEDDGTWGWYRDAYVPLSSRLFDKIEHRQFKLVSRVWLGENCVEGESTFGVSMLLRQVEMK